MTKMYLTRLFSAVFCSRPPLFCLWQKNEYRDDLFLITSQIGLNPVMSYLRAYTRTGLSTDWAGV